MTDLEAGGANRARAGEAASWTWAKFSGSQDSGTGRSGQGRVGNLGWAGDGSRACVRMCTCVCRCVSMLLPF